MYKDDHLILNSNVKLNNVIDSFVLLLVFLIFSNFTPKIERLL